MDELEDGGHYWVRWGDRWCVAEWYDENWWLCGTEVPKSRYEIVDYEGPIKPPDRSNDP